MGTSQGWGQGRDRPELSEEGAMLGLGSSCYDQLANARALFTFRQDPPRGWYGDDEALDGLVSNFYLAILCSQPNTNECVA